MIGLYDDHPERLAEKVQELIKQYESAAAIGSFLNTIKWSRNLKRRMRAGGEEAWDASRNRVVLYRPFCKKYLYDSKLFVDERGSTDKVFGSRSVAPYMCVSRGRRAKFAALAGMWLPSLDWYVPDAACYLPRSTLTRSGERVDNITDWALQQFQARYPQEGVTKDGIFAYCYAALHDPVWRETYAADLRREFPRIMLHDDFAQWRDWGQELLDLHIGYETVEPWALTRVEAEATPRRGRRGPLHHPAAPDGPPPHAGEERVAPKPILKSRPDEGVIVLDAVTQLAGVPRVAWDYRLGNRSAIDWVLDQHKEKTPRDPTVARLFNTYRFADYKERCVDLLARVVTVSVRTVEIVEAMRSARAQPPPPLAL